MGATEDRQREVEVSPSSQTTYRPIRKRAMPQMSTDPDMAEEVQKHVAQWMKQLPTYSWAMTDGDSTSEEEDQQAPRQRKQIKSGMDRTGATTVLKKVT